jgi:hypothetical protein
VRRVRMKSTQEQPSQAPPVPARWVWRNRWMMSQFIRTACCCPGSRSSRKLRVCCQLRRLLVRGPSCHSPSTPPTFRGTCAQRTCIQSRNCRRCSESDV